MPQKIHRLSVPKPTPATRVRKRRPPCYLPQRMNTALPPLIDSHCHLTWPSLIDDVPAIVERMEQQNVVQAVVVSTSVDDALVVRELSDAYDSLFPSAGIHPNDVPDALDSSLKRLRSLLASGTFVAVGETGLDYFRDHTDGAAQRESFRSHCELAREMDLPVIVHIRDKAGVDGAFHDVGEILASVPGVRGVIHCYTGDATFATHYQSLGMHVSFSGILTFPGGENVRLAADVVEPTRLLVETDSPFLAPVPRRGKRNEPSYVRHTARALAQRKGMSEAELAERTTKNARALFGLPIPTQSLAEH